MVLKIGLNSFVMDLIGWSPSSAEFILPFIYHLTDLFSEL